MWNEKKIFYDNHARVMLFLNQESYKNNGSWSYQHYNGVPSTIIQY